MKKEKYIDRYGVIWYRVDEYRVWNEQSGFGGWFNGNGLIKTI